MFIQVIALMFIFSAMAQDKKVAVFDPAGNADNSIKEIIREEISSIIVNTGGFTVLERQLINKVLEENKFQSGGLVDDSQISEIGKRMGANLVFVTSLTQMESKNYYVSCKMIDVQTARIEKQKTSQTIRGSSDLISTIQKLVGEMFDQKTGSTGNLKQEITPQISMPNSNNIDINISFREFKTQLKTERKEMRYEKKKYPDMLAGNKFALESYKKYRVEQITGWSLFGVGAVMLITGPCFVREGKYEEWWVEGDWVDGHYIDDPWGGSGWVDGYYTDGHWEGGYHESDPTGGIIVASIGGAAFIAGVGLLIASAVELKTTYHFYTKGGKTACTLNVQPLFSPKFQGVGLALKF